MSTGEPLSQTTLLADQVEVRRAYPSARVERRGLAYVAILAITRIDGKRRDNLIGSGRTNAEAWQRAAQRVRSAGEPAPDPRPASRDIPGRVRHGMATAMRAGVSDGTVGLRPAPDLTVCQTCWEEGAELQRKIEHYGDPHVE